MPVADHPSPARKLQPQLLPTDQDVQFYEDKGFWLSGKIIDDERLNLLREHMEKIYRQDYETGRPPFGGDWNQGNDPLSLRKTDNTHWSDYVLRDLALDETIGGIAAKLAKTNEIRLWHDQMLYKPGGGEGEGVVGWHQDHDYWQCANPPNLLSAWVAFDDVNEDNGCMEFVDGSHKMGHLSISAFFSSDREGQAKQIREKVGDFQVTKAILKAGEASYHHCLTLHGSGPNKTAKPRRSLVVHMMPGGTTYKAGTPSDPHMNVAILRGKDGDLFASDDFPVIWSARIVEH